MDEPAVMNSRPSFTTGIARPAPTASNFFDVQAPASRPMVCELIWVSVE
jgi:hypothetical protein